MNQNKIIDDIDYNDASWKIINSYFSINKGYQLIKHQIDTFNDFILRKLDQIIDGFNSIEINHGYNSELEKFKYVLIIDIRNPIINKPIIVEKDGSTKIMTPNDARKRNFTYASNLTVDIRITAKTLNEETNEYLEETKEMKNVQLGKIPIMVKSNYCVLKNTHDKNNNECIYDYGGYFVVNGNEKVILSQDRISENITFVFFSNKVSTYSHFAEIRSVQENKLGVPKITSIKLSSKSNQFGRYIRANIHHIKTDIPLFILFKALGLSSDKEIIEYIVYDLDQQTSSYLINELSACIEESNTVRCQRDALEYLAKYLNITGYPKEILFNKHHRINIVKTVLEKEFLPHVGKEYKQKALYLGYMVNKLLKCFLKLTDLDDRDSYINKRVDTPGVLMANLFRQYYGKVIKDMKNLLQKEINSGGWKATGKFLNVINKVNITKLFKSTIIDSGLRYALATGNWGIKNNKNKQGVAQVLNRMTYNSTLSHLRRINTPIEKSGKLIQPRKLHNTQWGIICPCECFDPNTPILMWDGTIKKAEDIIVGDYLIDDKGNSVRVKSTCSGFKNMYEIIPNKKNFMNYTVTDNHILTLKARNHKNIRTRRGQKEFMWFDKTTLKYKYKYFKTDNDLETFQSSIDDDDVIDITIETYLSLPKDVQKALYTFKSDGINWETKEVALDPYILGMWLGDGLSTGYGFITADKELLDKYIEWGVDNDATIKKGHKYKYGISSTINNTQEGIACNKTEQAPLKKLLTKYNLVNNKHIPLDYLVNDRKTRLALLAGLIDTDGNVRANGHEIRICQGEPNYKIIYDTEFLARSLGFSCHLNDGISSYTVNGEKRKTPYKELSITGKNLYEIPTVLPRKKLNKFDNPTSEKRCSSFLQSSFELVKKDIQPFVGWQVEGNGRFLLNDMTVSHNTPEGASVGLVKNMSIIANISISSNSTNVKEIVTSKGLIKWDPTNPKKFYNLTKVIINGDIYGFHENPDNLYHDLKILKRKGCINVYTSIVWNLYNNEINICTEGGRCIRPLVIVENNFTRLANPSFAKKEKYDWNELVIGTQKADSPNDNVIDNAVIEFLDVAETNASMIAMKYEDLKKGNKGTQLPLKYTHLEIHPITILGVAAANIPFSDHNQAPRNCYQCIGEEELVLMSNGERKPIKDIKIDDEVITFDPITMVPSITKVINQFVKPTEKKIYKIKTISGRSIIATNDHLFMTKSGWKKAEELNGDEKVGIFSGMSNPVSCQVDEYLILPILDIKSLNDSGLLPLYSTNNKLSIISRMCGFILSNKFRFTDNKQFKNDLEYLGITYDIFKLLIGYLDISCNLIPEWVMNGSLNVQREFIAGFLGGDCYYNNVISKIILIKNSNILIDFCEQLKITMFFEQLKIIINRLGVETNEITITKFKENMIKISLTVLNENINIIKYLENIGVRYDNKKIIDYAKELEYLKYKNINPNTDLTINLWNKYIDYMECTIFVPIESIEEVPNCMIADITVDNENHSFIAGDSFQVHNSSMTKQAIGIYASNYRERFDTLAHVLNYGQKPLVRTKMAKILKSDNLPNGINTIVAIMTYTGYNQEDSVILNQSAIDRGLFTSTYYRTYKEQNNKNHSNGEEEFFTKPETGNINCPKPYVYDKLTSDGFVPENTFVKSGDIIIGKCMPNKSGNSITYKDNSIPLTTNEKGFIDRNCYNDNYFKTVNGDGYTFCKVRIRSDRVPVIGDKLACFHKETEILTTRGWVAFPELTIDDTVASMVNDELVYQKPKEVQSYDFNGKLYNIDSNQVQLSVTDNHRMYISHRGARKFVLEEAKDVYRKRYYYKKNVDKWNPSLKDAPIELVISDNKITHFWIQGDGQDNEDLILNIDSWLTFFGIWMAEGCATTQNRVCFAADKPKVREVLGPICDEFGFNVSKCIYRETGVNWVMCNTTLHSYMEHLSVGAINKFLPEWVWFLSREQSRTLIQGMMYGDGDKPNDSGTKRYYTSSTKLADDFQRLCLHAGYSTNKIKRTGMDAGTTGIIRGKTIMRNADAYMLNIITSQNEPIVNKNYIKATDEGAVDSWIDYNDKVYCCTVPKGNGVIYVRKNGFPVWSGNSRMAQKGTIGITYMQEDMPFTSGGITPDIIMNPNAIPSRMTMGQLMECLMGKACVMSGTYGDSTPFTECQVEDIAKVLEESGLERYGNEIMYDPRTGKQMSCDIFIGPTFYQRLKHMTVDKIHSRSNNGPVVMLTRQPAEGRSRRGGLRLGEMEIECNWAHGITQFLKERIMECSDNYRVHVCKACGYIAIANPEKNIFNCRNCKNITNFAEIRIPYAAKLLCQEIQTMSIGMKFIT